MFTFCTLVTSVILYQGLKASGTQIMTVVLAFFIICSGIFILQMSKVDPRDLVNVDERTTLLLQAARAEVDPKAARELEREISLASRLSRRRTGTSMHTYPGSRIIPVNGADLESMVPVPSNRPGDDGTATDAQVLLEENIDPEEEVKAMVEKIEDPGIDALRGTFGAIGTLIRARKRKTALAQVLQQQRSRTASHASRSSAPMSFISNTRSYIRPSQSRTKEKESGFVADPEKQAMRSYSLMSETPSGTSSVQQQQHHPLTASPELHASPRLPPSVQFSDMELNGGGRSAPVTSTINNRTNEDPLDRAGAALSPKRAQTLPAIFKRGIPISFLDEKKDP